MESEEIIAAALAMGRIISNCEQRKLLVDLCGNSRLPYRDVKSVISTLLIAHQEAKSNELDTAELR